MNKELCQQALALMTPPLLVIAKWRILSLGLKTHRECVQLTTNNNNAWCNCC